jgi:hypothetical protein
VDILRLWCLLLNMGKQNVRVVRGS